MSAVLKADNWTKEKRVQLIWEYRSRPVIWDRSDKYFEFKKKQRAQAWEEISKALNSPTETCMQMIRCLRQKFFQTHHKMFKSGKSIINSYDWILYKEMTFLLDHKREQKQPGLAQTVTETQKKITVQIAEEKQNIISATKPQTQLFLEIKKGVVKPVARTMIVHELSPVGSRQGPRPKRPKPDNAISSTQIIMPKLVPTTMKDGTFRPLPGPSRPEPENKSNRTATDFFLDFLTRKLKSYSENNRMQLQHDITEAIYKADNRESEKKFNVNSTEQSVNEMITPDLDVDYNNANESEPHTYEFLDSGSDFEPEMYNETDDMFEVYENKHDVLLNTENNEHFEDDNEGFEEVYLEIENSDKNYKQAYTESNERNDEIKDEMTETDDEDEED